MKALVLVLVDTPSMLPEHIRGSQIVAVDVTVQSGDPDYRHMRRWNLGQIEARVVDLSPTIALEYR